MQPEFATSAGDCFLGRRAVLPHALHERSTRRVGNELSANRHFYFAASRGSWFVVFALCLVRALTDLAGGGRKEARSIR